MIKKIKVEDAVGITLLHDLTGSVNGKKCTIFKRGHVIKDEDIETLIINGKMHINVANDILDNTIHEEDAAKMFGETACGENVILSNIVEGKINFVANKDGFLNIDSDKIYDINMFDKVSFATKKNLEFVKKGDVIASFRIVELFYNKDEFYELLKLSNRFINIDVVQIKTVALITVGSEIYYNKKQDLSFDRVNDKLEKYNLKVNAHYVCDDDEMMLCNVLKEYNEKYDCVLCIGGMSVDADDITASTISNFSDFCIYGTPIIPGSVFLISKANNKYILGLPANVIFSEYTAFDILMPYVLLNKEISKSIIAKYGEGGLI